MNNTGPIRRRSTGTIIRIMSVMCLLVATFALAAQEPGQTPPPTDVNKKAQVRPEEELIRLDPPEDYFSFIEDDGPFPYRGNKILDPKKDMAATKELKAYDYVLAFASKQKHELLSKYSARNVPYGNFFKPIRAEYLRELIHIEGKLALILPMKATDGLRDLDNIDKLYEAWIYPTGHSEPLCLVVSELPEGVTPGENQTIKVSFDAYFFKMFHYESRQAKAGDADKKQWRRAPLFLGKSFENKGSATSTEPLYTDNMLLTIVLFLLTVFLIVGAVGWWLKRGGRYVEEEKRRRLEASQKFMDESL